jgi:hypothetical protein
VGELCGSAWDEIAPSELHPESWPWLGTPRGLGNTPLRHCSIGHMQPRVEVAILFFANSYGILCCYTPDCISVGTPPLIPAT